MKWSKSLYIGIICSVLSLSLGEPQARVGAQTKKKTCWLLIGKDENIGNFKAYVTDDAVCVLNIKTGRLTMARAPGYQVAYFDPKNKVEFKSDLNQWSGALTDYTKRRQASDKPNWLPAGSEVFLGQNCILSRNKWDPSKKYWLSSEIKTSPEVAEMLARNFNYAVTDKIVLRIFQTRKEAPKDVALLKRQTSEYSLSGKEFGRHDAARDSFLVSSCEKIPYKSSDFPDLTGFKLVQHCSDVTLSGLSQKEVYTLFDDLGFSTSSNKK